MYRLLVCLRPYWLAQHHHLSWNSFRCLSVSDPATLLRFVFSCPTPLGHILPFESSNMLSHSLPSEQKKNRMLLVALEVPPRYSCFACQISCHVSCALRTRPSTVTMLWWKGESNWQAHLEHKRRCSFLKQVFCKAYAHCPVSLSSLRSTFSSHQSPALIFCHCWNHVDISNIAIFLLFPIVANCVSPNLTSPSAHVLSRASSRCLSSGRGFVETGVQRPRSPTALSLTN